MGVPRRSSRQALLLRRLQGRAAQWGVWRGAAPSSHAGGTPQATR